MNFSAYDMTPDKVFLPSTKDNYNVDDLSSHDETDNEENPRKDVPQWANSECLEWSSQERMQIYGQNLGKRLEYRQKIIRRLLTTQKIEQHFGHIEKPDLLEIFPNTKQDKFDHSTSAIWSSPLSDPTPGEARFFLFQNGLRPLAKGE